MDTVKNILVDRLEDDEAFIGNLLAPVILSALSEKGFKKPMRIQNRAVRAIVEHDDVIIRAKTGSGKTLAYVMFLLYACSSFLFRTESAPSVLVILPTPDLCLEVVELLATLVNLCFPDGFKIGQLTSTTLSQMDLLKEIPNIAVSTPSWLLRYCFLQDKARRESLKIIVLDEVDQLMLDDNDYENVLKPLIANLAEDCRCIVVSDDPSSDLRKLKTLVRRTPYIVTLAETGILEAGIIPYNVQQSYVSCKTKDRILYLFSLWVFSYISETTLIFTNSIKTSNELKGFFEKFGLKSAVVYDGMRSRRKIIEELKSRGLDFIIATDKSDDNPISSLLGEIDWNDVGTVVNFDMPRTVSGYLRRIDHTRKNTAFCISLVSTLNDEKIWRKIKCRLGVDSKFITPVELSAYEVGGHIRRIVKKARSGVNCEVDLEHLWVILGR